MTALNTTSRTASKANLLPISGFRDPMSLTNCVGWWDFSAAQYLSTATNGIGAVSDGSAIAYCFDRSGNGRHLTQATANNRPTWSSTGLNSLGAGSFNGTTNFLSTAASFGPWTGDQSFSWAAVFTRAAATSGWIACSATNVGNNSSVLIGDAYNSSFSGNRILNYGGSAIMWGTANQTTGTGFVISGYSSAGARNVSSFLRNGTQSHLTSQSATTSTLSASAAALEMGRGYIAGYQYHNGLLAEIAIYSRVLLAAELTALTRYLGAKWNITVA